MGHKKWEPVTDSRFAITKIILFEGKCKSCLTFFHNPPPMHTCFWMDENGFFEHLVSSSAARIANTGAARSTAKSEKL
jgi:hypothetical protein